MFLHCCFPLNICISDTVALYDRDDFRSCADLGRFLFASKHLNPSSVENDGDMSDEIQWHIIV